MTKGQFKRLFLVLFFPLLIMGIILGTIIFNNSEYKYAWPLCINYASYENCRYLGNPNEKFYKSTLSDHPAWFDVIDSTRESFTVDHVRASERLVENVRIVEATPFSSGQSRSFDGPLAGRLATVKLGARKGENSIVTDSEILLVCTTLFIGSGGQYSSECYGDGWSVAVTYEAIGESLEELERLLAAVRELSDSRMMEYRFHQLGTYPVFIYLFLTVSLLVWSIKKAARFVRGS